MGTKCIVLANIKLLGHPDAWHFFTSILLHLVLKSRMCGAIPPLPHTSHGTMPHLVQDVFMAWYLVKYRDSLTFTLP